MSELQWFTDLVVEAERDPRRLMRTLHGLSTHQLPLGIRVLDYVHNPAARVFGYTALARRGYRPGEVIEGVAGAIKELPEDDRATIFVTLKKLIPAKEQGLMAQIVKELEPRLPKYERKKLQSLATYRGKSFDQHRARKAGTQLPLKVVAKYSDQAGTERHIERDAVDGTAAALAREIRPPMRFGKVTFSALDDLPNAPDGATSERQRAAAERVVSSGFAISAAPAEPSDAPLAPDAAYWFWVEIGAPVARSLEVERVQLQPFVGPGMTVDVLLFTNDEGLVIDGPVAGSFIVSSTNDVVVATSAARPNTADEELLTRRLFFSIRTPPGKTRCAMRCSFYCEGVLIQSRDVQIPLDGTRPPSVRADYVLARSLAAEHLAALAPPQLSIMLNENADGTHAFRFYARGETPFIRSVHFSEAALQDLIEKTRKGLRLVSWASEEEWSGQPYRHDLPGTVDTILPDLIVLAKRGRVAWDGIVDRLGRGQRGSDVLETLMRPSGVVHLALRESPNAIVPLAALYDYPLDTALPDEQMELCSGFRAALARPTFDGHPCFDGRCPSLSSENVVCPGGFWGFRHVIGLPVSIGSDQDSPPDTPVYVSANATGMNALLSMDPALRRRDRHIEDLRALLLPVAIREAKSRNDALAAMQTATPSVVYFYCHGGDDPVDGPYLQVGALNEPWIARNTFRLRKIRWTDPRPLVFINGCHTTNLEPERAIDLVSALVASVGAAGVIGSEITIFESLAVQFAEYFFEEFATKRASAGVAVRRARLRILKETLNPLALVYIPFVLPSLYLQRPAA